MPDTPLSPLAASPSPAVVTPPESSSAQAGRELLTGVISLAILVAAITAFGFTFSAGRQVFTGKESGQKEAYERQKDLLGLAVGLLGTVTGYYLGRVPAELRAQGAQGLLKDATAATAQANQNTESVKRDARTAADAALAALKAQPAAPSAEARSRGVVARNETDVEPPDIEKARELLDRLVRRL